MNMSTALILIVVIALVVLAIKSIVKMHRDKGCCGHCSGCARASECSHGRKR